MNICIKVSLRILHCIYATHTALLVFIRTLLQNFIVHNKIMYRNPTRIMKLVFPIGHILQCADCQCFVLYMYNANLQNLRSFIFGVVMNVLDITLLISICFKPNLNFSIFVKYGKWSLLNFFHAPICFISNIKYYKLYLN